MKKTLFIGSTVLDIIVNTDHLPENKEDINTRGIDLSIGGCAYNACSIVEYFNLPVVSCSPIGTGHFASILENLLKKKNKEPWIRIKDEDNGCCICLVDKDGERTFLCQHGAEYRFEREWLKDIDLNDLDYIYVCGLELEDENGEEILKYLEESNVKIFFAPGSRMKNIQSDRMKRMLALHPVLHLNEDEAGGFTGNETISYAAKQLYDMTKELVIVTCGERGAYYVDKYQAKLIPGIRTVVADTIGAGDAHAGACIAGLKIGQNIDEILNQANKISAKVVSVHGASLTEKEFFEAVE